MVESDETIVFGMQMKSCEECSFRVIGIPFIDCSTYMYEFANPAICPLKILLPIIAVNGRFREMQSIDFQRT